MSRVASPAERRLSYLLLALLPAIAWLVYLKGQRYDPGLFALDPASLESTRRAPVAAGPTPALAGALVIEPLPGWRAEGPPEVFTAETLYRKIDGRADEFVAHGMRLLWCASFSDGGRFIDVFAYDMGTPGHAADMYAVERPAEPAAAALGDEGYRAEASWFFRRGAYYVQVIASDDEESVAAATLALARAVNEALSKAPSHPEGAGSP